MSTDSHALTGQQSGEVVQRADDVLSIIAAAARDPQVDPAKLTALLNLKERVDAREAEMEFNRAFARLQTRLPRVKKNGTIDLGRGKPICFAKWEDVDRVLRPLLAAEGFTLSFLSKPTDKGVLMTCVLAHAAGHSTCSDMQLPADSGPGRNALQAIGSSRSYGKRYLACDILNIITEGADDDGNGAYLIDDSELGKLNDLADACKLTPDRRKKLLAIAGVDSFDNLHKGDQYAAILESLNKTYRQSQGAR